jgi:hypothetical protein
MLKYIYSVRGAFPANTGVVWSAICSKNIAMVQWLLEKGQLVEPHNGFLTTHAANNVDMNMLKYLHAQGFKCTGSAYQAAALHNSLELFTWLHNIQCPWDASSNYLVSMVSDIQCLIFLQQHSLGHWSIESMSNHLKQAAINNWHYTMQWYRQQGAQWLTDTVVTRDNEGRISSIIAPECLKWAIQHGCSWGYWSSTQVCDSLKSFSKGQQLVSIAHTLGCPCACIY